MLGVMHGVVLLVSFRRSFGRIYTETLNTGENVGRVLEKNIILDDKLYNFV